MGKLTAVAVKAALANPGTYQDGDGLFLKVGKTGSASWLLRVQQDGKAHVVPLSDAALAVLAKADAFKVEGAEVVFSGATGKAMSDMTLLKVLRDMQEPFHVHGFRSAFTDWAANAGFPNAVVEAALAHKTPDAVQAAYRRTTYLGTKEDPGMRVKLMDAWGAYCAGAASYRMP